MHMQEAGIKACSSHHPRYCIVVRACVLWCVCVGRCVGHAVNPNPNHIVKPPLQDVIRLLDITQNLLYPRILMQLPRGESYDPAFGTLVIALKPNRSPHWEFLTYRSLIIAIFENVYASTFGSHDSGSLKPKC